MMKSATIRFETEEELTHALNGSAYMGALQEFDNYLRGRLKYEELPDDVQEALQTARNRLHDECSTIWDCQRFKHNKKSWIAKLHGWLKSARRVKRLPCQFCTP